MQMIFSAQIGIKGLFIHKANVYDHTTLKAPHPARSAKLSNVGLSSVPESETIGIKELFIDKANVYDHTTLKAPHPARSAKLSNVGLSSVPESETVWEHAVS
ncbi:hypothetical protein T4A_9993 [Trichinella pseudospiralis]|uniref:Uncharacterized protein n=1 Tax=Trichinella pseudospiralis TaxID=6337 RepID=A0A0V1F0K4_TRIPS|nr:hypothetical protein T4A_9993 [Trichinella pseudospiralis]